MGRPSRVAWILASALAATGTRLASAQTTPNADVVVVVDTSTSMREPGMDPERASLLVARLLSDLVPGQLAVIRLLDISADKALIPSKGTGRHMPCSEDPLRTCEQVDAASDWEKDARQQKFGALIRPARGDSSYKQELEAHLAQGANNSMFHLAFRAAQGIFDSHAGGPARTVIWLSDGRSDGESVVQQVIGEFRAGGVQVEPIVFGRGDPRLVMQAGLSPRKVGSPADMMKAFAGVFRRIVGAPYELDGLVSNAPSFEMKPDIDDAWIVVYGDDTLSDASVDGPAGATRTDYAIDRHAGAGAYRVAHVTRPVPGRWVVKATGGGLGVAYAVVQRSGISPRYLSPATAFANAPVSLLAQLQTSDGQTLGGADIPAGLTLEAQFESQSTRMFDDGAHGDGAAGDGTYGATVTFTMVGDAKVVLRARSDVIDKSTDSIVKVTGFFRYRGGPLEVDLGQLPHTGESCRPLTLDAEHQGGVPFELRSLQPLGYGHRLEVRAPRGIATAGGSSIVIGPGEALQICLVTSGAVSSNAKGEPWTELRPTGSTQTGAVLRMRWHVQGMTFWQRWGRLILLILLLIALAVIVYGYIKPIRFSRGLALVFVSDKEDLDDSPQPLAQWKGVGIGWYRDSRAFLHSSFRVSDESRGAIASLRAVRGGTWVRAENGHALCRETVDGDWEQVQDHGRNARSGEVYRVGDHGPFFRLSVRVS